MRYLTALLLLIATWYLAGMHRQAPMMAVMICGVIVVVLSFVLSFVQRRRISAGMSAPTLCTYKGVQTRFSFHIRNDSRLPVNHFRLNFLMQYRGDRRKTRKRLCGCAGDSRHNEGNEAEFYFSAPYCGLVDVELRRIRVYDYFRLFSFSKRLKTDKAQIYVLPYPRDMHILSPMWGSSAGEPVAETVNNTSGDDFSEIRLIREYRDGDITRHLHRNYSARTGKLWIKEYYRDNDRIIPVYLDTSSQKKLTPARRDAFYEMVSSVLTGCSKLGLTLRVYFIDAASGMAKEWVVRMPDDVTSLFAELYRTNTDCTAGQFATVFPDTTKGMIMDTELSWSMNEELIYRFDEKNITHELETRAFDIGR